MSIFIFFFKIWSGYEYMHNFFQIWSGYEYMNNFFHIWSGYEYMHHFFPIWSGYEYMHNFFKYFYDWHHLWSKYFLHLKFKKKSIMCVVIGVLSITLFISLTRGSTKWNLILKNPTRTPESIFRFRFIKLCIFWT